MNKDEFWNTDLEDLPGAANRERIPESVPMFTPFVSLSSKAGQSYDEALAKEADNHAEQFCLEVLGAQARQTPVWGLAFTSFKDGYLKAKLGNQYSQYQLAQEKQ